MTGYITLGCIILILGIAVYILIKVNKGLRDDNKEKDKALKQRSNNLSAHDALQGKIADIKKESNNEKNTDGTVADWLNKL